MKEQNGGQPIALTPRELDRLTENNAKPYILPAGTRIEICLRRHGHSAMEFGARGEDTPQTVGTFTLGSEVPIVIDSTSEGVGWWEMYLKPTSEALLRAGRVLDKLEGMEGATDEIREFCKNGQIYVAAGALAEIEDKIVRDNPGIARAMAKAGLTTVGYDIVFHLKS